MRDKSAVSSEHVSALDANDDSNRVNRGENNGTPVCTKHERDGGKSDLTVTTKRVNLGW